MPFRAKLVFVCIMNFSDDAATLSSSYEDCSRSSEERLVIESFQDCLPNSAENLKIERPPAIAPRPGGLGPFPEMQLYTDKYRVLEKNVLTLTVHNFCT